MLRDVVGSWGVKDYRVGEEGDEREGRRMFQYSVAGRILFECVPVMIFIRKLQHTCNIRHKVLSPFDVFMITKSYSDFSGRR